MITFAVKLRKQSCCSLVLYSYKLSLTYLPGFKVKDRDLNPNPEFHEKQDPDSDPKKTLL